MAGVLTMPDIGPSDRRNGGPRRIDSGPPGTGTHATPELTKGAPAAILATLLTPKPAPEVVALFDEVNASPSAGPTQMVE